MSHGWIKVHRKLLQSQMYKSLNSKQRDVLMQCLLMADHVGKSWEYKGVIFKTMPGQFVTSLDSIVKNCASDVKVQSVRTALLKLEKWGFLTNESTKTGRLITIVKWDTYQCSEDNDNKATNKGLTKGQQRSNKELTSNNNNKNDKNDKKYNPKRACDALDWIDKKVWCEWIDHKIKKKASLTERAINKNISDLEKMGKEHANEIIEQSLDSGWSGLFPLKNEQKNQQYNISVPENRKNLVELMRGIK